MEIRGNSNPEITNNEIRSNTQNGIFIHLEGHGTISGNLISNNGLHGIEVKDGSNPKIKDNEIKANTQVGIVAKSGSSGTISGNVISNNGYAGIVISDANSDPQILYNTIVTNGWEGIWVYLDAAPVISNNIVARNRLHGINTKGISGDSDGNPTVSFNNFWENGQGNYNGIEAPLTDMSEDPFFVDSANDDYHLQANSPCRGASDDGRDLGAYQFQTIVEPPARTLSISSAEAAPGDSITIQISITDTTGIASGDMVVKYDPAVITINDVQSTVLTADMGLTANKNTAGEIKIGMARAEGLLSGSGALVDIMMTISDNAPVDTETTLSFSDTEIWDELAELIPVKFENGVVKIRHSGIKGDVNKDGRVRSNDAALTLRIVAQLMIPDSYQNWAADMNGDGAVRANDAALILREATGLAAPGTDIIASVGRQITISLSEAYGVAGESITVPIWIDNADMLASGYISMAYDSSVLRATDISSDSDALMVSNTSEPGILHIAFAGTSAMNVRTLAKIQFNVLADDVSPLTLKNVELYGTDALPLATKHINTEFRSWAMPPEHSALLQNFPNPFNPETWIPYQLRKGSDVTIRIYNLSGQLVRELPLGYRAAGMYVSQDRAAHWDGHNETGEPVASGIYWLMLKAGEYGQVRRMVLVK